MILRENLFAFPARLGGLGISNPVYLSSGKFNASVKITKPFIKSLILSQDVRTAQIALMSKIRHLKSSYIALVCSDLLDQASPSLKRSVEVVSERGASSWLTVLLWKEHGFALHKIGFHDAIALVGILPGFPFIAPVVQSLQLSILFLVLKEAFFQLDTMGSVTSLLIFWAMKYNISSQLLLSNFLWLLPTVMMALVWIFLEMVSGEGELSLMSRFLIPMLQPSNPTTPRRIYRRYESVKTCNYEARIREVECTTFTPLVFSASGEMADEACAFYKCLASLLCDKWS